MRAAGELSDEDWGDLQSGIDTRLVELTESEAANA
jgi:hypothetical protein